MGKPPRRALQTDVTAVCMCETAAVHLPPQTATKSVTLFQLGTEVSLGQSNQYCNKYKQRHHRAVLLGFLGWGEYVFLTPAEWTIHLGAPVVPEEYMMNRGWLNGSCSNSSWGNWSPSPRPVARKSSINILWKLKKTLVHYMRQRKCILKKKVLPF